MDKKLLPKSKRVLLLVDFINPLDFPGSKELAPPAIVAARNTAKLRGRMQSQRVPVIYANDNFGSWCSDFKELVAKLEKSQGPSSTLVRLLKPRRTDLTILKPMHSAFFGSPLEVLLDFMKTEELVIAGLACDMCVQFTAMDAHLRGYKLWVPSDCTASETEEAKKQSLKFMKANLKCSVAPSA